MIWNAAKWATNQGITKFQQQSGMLHEIAKLAVFIMSLNAQVVGLIAQAINGDIVSRL